MIKKRLGIANEVFNKERSKGGNGKRYPVAATASGKKEERGKRKD